MELYLRWLEENLMQPGEEPPLGLILCAGKTEGHVRLLKLEESGIHAAQYLTELLGFVGFRESSKCRYTEQQIWNFPAQR